MENKDIEETNLTGYENQHKNLPKLEDLKTDEDIKKFFNTDYRNPHHPSLKINDKWGKLMKKNDKSLEDLEKLYWYNDNQKERDFRYQFLWDEWKSLRDYYFEKFIEESNLRTFFTDSMIEELDSEGIVTKDEIVEYYLKGKKKRGKITERRKYDPSPILEPRKLKDDIFDSYDYYMETISHWTRPERDDLHNWRVEYPCPFSRERYDDFEIKPSKYQISGWKEDYTESDNESKEEVK